MLQLNIFVHNYKQNKTLQTPISYIPMKFGLVLLWLDSGDSGEESSISELCSPHSKGVHRLLIGDSKFDHLVKGRLSSFSDPGTAVIHMPVWVYANFSLWFYRGPFRSFIITSNSKPGGPSWWWLGIRGRRKRAQISTHLVCALYANDFMKTRRTLNNVCWSVRGVK